MPIVGFTIPQGPELFVLLGIVVLLFGAKKLPELGSSIGKTITNFKRGVNEGQAEAEAAAEHDEVTSETPPASGEASNTRDTSS